jgi:hypothetical protein
MSLASRNIPTSTRNPQQPADMLPNSQQMAELR